MKQIPQEFRKNGFDYKISQRRYNVVLLSQSKNKRLLGYEVHTIKKRKSHQIDQNVIPSGEYLASNEMFGQSTWSFQNEYYALLKYKELVIKAKSLGVSNV